MAAAWESNGRIAGAVRTSKALVPLRFATEAKQKHPRLAVNPKGQALLVWTEGTGHAHGGSLAWQLFEADGKPTRIAGHAPAIPALSFAAAVPRRDGGFVVFY